MGLTTKILATLVLGTATGCSGGNAPIAGSVPALANAAAISVNEARLTSEAQSAAVREPQQVASTMDLLYVGNTGNNSITVYRHDAQGNTLPLHVIAGPKTGLSDPGQLSEDAQGNLYVANGNANPGSSLNPAVLVFARGADGNVAPLRTLAGPLTGIHSIEAMTVDKTTGKIFVIDALPGTNGRFIDVSLLRFAPNASGNVAPFARTTPDLSPTFELASDSTGQDLLAAHSPKSTNSLGNGIATVVKQFANDAQPSFVYDVYAMAAAGVADDPTTKTYLESATNESPCPTTGCGIYRLAENTTGYGPFQANPVSLTPRPLSVLTSDTCGTQLALGYLRNMYVTHSTDAGCSADAIYVYAHDATGNAAPLRVLAGSATGLNRPFGIYEGR